MITNNKFQVFLIRNNILNNSILFEKITDYQDELKIEKISTNNRGINNKPLEETTKLYGHYCYTYNEKIEFHANSQKSFSFTINKNIMKSDAQVENPFFDVLVEGTQILVRDKYDNDYLFTISNISYEFASDNIIANIQCQDSFTYQMIRKNDGYTIKNDIESVDFLGAHPVDWWVEEKIVPDCHIPYKYIKCGEIKVNIKDDYTKFNDFITFSASGNADSVLISLGESLGLNLVVYEKMVQDPTTKDYHIIKEFWYEPSKKENRITGLFYSPYDNIKEHQLTHDATSLSTVLNVNSYTGKDEKLISLLPEVPQLFATWFQSHDWEQSRYLQGMFTSKCSERIGHIEDGQPYSLDPILNTGAVKIDQSINSSSSTKDYKIAMRNNPDSGLLEVWIPLFDPNKTIDQQVFTLEIPFESIDFNIYDKSVSAKDPKHRSFIYLNDGLAFNSASQIWKMILVPISEKNKACFEKELKYFEFSASEKLPQNLLGQFYLFLKIETKQIDKLGQYSLWWSFNRTPQQDEQEFAYIADRCPWLENKLVDFSYFLQNQLLNKGMYHRLLDILDNKLRIINGKLLASAKVYTDAISNKIQQISTLENSLDKIGAIFHGDFLSAYENKNTVSKDQIKQFNDEYSILFKNTSLQKALPLMDWSATISGYFNKYLLAEQNFLKNIYNFRKFFYDKPSISCQEKNVFLETFELLPGTSKSFTFKEPELTDSYTTDETLIPVEEFQNALLINTVVTKQDPKKALTVVGKENVTKFYTRTIKNKDVLQLYEGNFDPTLTYYTKDNQGNYTKVSHEDMYLSYVTKYPEKFEIHHKLGYSGLKEALPPIKAGGSVLDQPANHLDNTNIFYLGVPVDIVSEDNKYSFKKTSDTMEYFSTKFVTVNNWDTVFHPVTQDLFDSIDIYNKDKNTSLTKKLFSTSGEQQLKQWQNWHQFKHSFATEGEGTCYPSGDPLININTEKVDPSLSTKFHDATQPYYLLNADSYAQIEATDWDWHSNKKKDKQTVLSDTDWSIIGRNICPTEGFLRNSDYQDLTKNYYIQDVKWEFLSNTSGILYKNRKYKIYYSDASDANLTNWSSVTNYDKKKLLLEAPAFDWEGANLTQVKILQYLASIFPELTITPLKENNKQFNLGSYCYCSILEERDYEISEKAATKDDLDLIYFTDDKQKVNFEHIADIANGYYILKDNQEIQYDYNLATTYNEKEEYYFKQDNEYILATNIKTIQDHFTDYYYRMPTVTFTTAGTETNTPDGQEIPIQKDNEDLKNGQWEVVSDDTWSYIDTTTGLPVIGLRLKDKQDNRIEGLTNGEIWYKFRNTPNLNSEVFKLTTDIESTLTGYWKNAYQSSKFCHYFIPEFWTPSVKQNNNNMCSDVLVIETNKLQSVQSLIHLNSALVPMVDKQTTNNRNREFYQYNWKYDPKDTILAAPFDVVEEDIYKWYSGQDVINNNQFLITTFNHFKDFKPQDWKAQPSFKREYYYVISGGSSWVQVLQKVVTLSKWENWIKFGGWYEMAIRSLNSPRFIEQDMSKYQELLKKHNQIWDELYRDFDSILLEQVYNNEDATTSAELYRMGSAYLKDLSIPERAYNISVINSNQLREYRGQEIRIGDPIQLKADEYYDGEGNIKNSLKQFLFVSDISYEMRASDEMSLTVNDIKYQDKLMQKIANLIR